MIGCERLKIILNPLTILIMDGSFGAISLNLWVKFYEFHNTHLASLNLECERSKVLPPQA